MQRFSSSLCVFLAFECLIKSATCKDQAFHSGNSSTSKAKCSCTVKHQGLAIQRPSILLIAGISPKKRPQSEHKHDILKQCHAIPSSSVVLYSQHSLQRPLRAYCLNKHCIVKSTVGSSFYHLQVAHRNFDLCYKSQCSCLGVKIGLVKFIPQNQFFFLIHRPVAEDSYCFSC